MGTSLGARITSLWINIVSAGSFQCDEDTRNKPDSREKALIYWLLAFGIFLYWSFNIINIDERLTSDTSKTPIYKTNCAGAS